LNAPGKFCGAGNETKIDLPRAEFSASGKNERRYFVQLAGAGLDARAIELVDWRHKKKVGPLAYVVAGLKALRETKPKLPCSRGRGKIFTGELVLIGNGKFYGGPFEIFPQADLRDGLLDVCILPRVDFPTLLRCAAGLVARRKLPEKIARRFRAAAFELSGDSTLDLNWTASGLEICRRDIFGGARKVARRLLIRLVGWQGLEPWTNALKGHCSTD
jgi:diacylglycerol kinase family enzyme